MKETRKTKMIIRVMVNDKEVNTIELKGKSLINRTLTYLSGAYGKVIDKNLKFLDNRSTTFTFKVIGKIDTKNKYIFDTTIENFDLFLV